MLFIKKKIIIVDNSMIYKKPNEIIIKKIKKELECNVLTNVIANEFVTKLIEIFNEFASYVNENYVKEESISFEENHNY